MNLRDKEFDTLKGKFFNSEDVKEAILHFEKIIKEGIEDNSIEDIKHCMLIFRDIFGDFENEKED